MIVAMKEPEFILFCGESADPFTEKFPYQYVEHWKGRAVEFYEVLLPDSVMVEGETLPCFAEETDNAEMDTMLRDMGFYRYRAMRQAVGTGTEMLLYAAVTCDEVLDRIDTVSYFRDYAVSDGDIRNIMREMPDTTLFCIAKKDKEIYEMELKKDRECVIRPINFRDANRYIADHHRHNSPVSGGKFAISMVNGSEEVVGVATCGRPVSRLLQENHPMMLEITRVCTDGGENICSRLYARCCDVARDLGYEEVITYTLESEGGASLRASGFEVDCENAGGTWKGKRFESRVRKDEPKIPEGKKIRWIKRL